MAAHLTTYDCTLRDGEQGFGMSLSVDDKLKIALRLDAFGIDVIEGGYPASNPKDAEFFREVQNISLTHARIAAFGSTCKKNCRAQEDQGLASLAQCGADIVTLVGKCWDIQVTEALRTTLDENVRMVSDSIAYLVSQGIEVFFDAEHYFDGFRAHEAYALRVIKAAAFAGAKAIILCETNGGALPDEVKRITAQTCQALDEVGFAGEVGIHCHNDSGCAVANTLAAISAGARQLQGTINGYGERCGNTNLLTCIANLQLKAGYKCVPHLEELTPVAHFVADVCNTSIPLRTPYAGSAAFAHKAGLHASALARLHAAYEHESPDAVGNTSHILVSELAGRASLVAKAASLGFSLESSDATTDKILADLKAREAQGYSYEIADGSLALLICKHLGQDVSHFTLESFRVIVDDREDAGAWAADAQSEATIKIRAQGRRLVSTGEGCGPVEALDQALRSALVAIFPEIEKISLVDYKVRILDENVGTAAVTRVVITSQDKQGVWGTVGVSQNIIEASWNALVDSIEFGLLRMGNK